jgi:hypothetical protein
MLPLALHLSHQLRLIYGQAMCLQDGVRGISLIQDMLNGLLP